MDPSGEEKKGEQLLSLSTQAKDTSQCGLYKDNDTWEVHYNIVTERVLKITKNILIGKHDKEVGLWKSNIQTDVWIDN